LFQFSLKYLQTYMQRIVTIGNVLDQFWGHVKLLKWNSLLIFSVVFKASTFHLVAVTLRKLSSGPIWRKPIANMSLFTLLFFHKGFTERSDTFSWISGACLVTQNCHQKQAQVSKRLKTTVKPFALTPIRNKIKNYSQRQTNITYFILRIYFCVGNIVSWLNRRIQGGQSYLNTTNFVWSVMNRY